jgi:uncharacterized membrane-anchored protein
MEKKFSEKSKGNQYHNLIILIILLSLILFGFLVYTALPLLGSNTYVLKTQPIDPFDPLMGQHIIINYEISRIPLLEGAKSKDSVYVILKEENGLNTYSSASLVKPKDGDFIKGTIENIYMANMNINYGIERYYFEKGAVFSTENMTVEIRVTNSGRARITRLLSDGNPLEISYKNKSFTS